MKKNGKFIPCATCGKDVWVVPSKKNKRFCSNKCKGAPGRKRVKKICFHCKKEYEVFFRVAKRNIKHFHCSYFCANQTNRGARKKSFTKFCFFCGDLFNVTPFFSFRKFCTHDCSVKARWGSYKKGDLCPKEKESKI